MKFDTNEPLHEIINRYLTLLAAVLATINAYAHAVSYTGLFIRNNFNIDPATWHDIRNVTTFLSKVRIPIIWRKQYI